ncbi:MAG TPA: hypothetical protein VE621_00470 [Bryobacteraceae bacterium]|nr:hypothetical protein [Bryobacteraceae bacterium]
MSKRSLGAIAIILIALMAIVAFAGLDHLPGELRKDATSAVRQVASDRSQFEQDRAAIQKALADEPALFASRAVEWRSKLQAAATRIADEEARAAKLKPLVEANRREDREQVAQQLRQLDSVRSQIRSDTQGIRQEAERWIRYKQQMPELLASMKQRYAEIQSFDVDSATQAVTKASVDWPSKQGDLKARVAALSEMKTAAERSWEATAEARSKAEAKDWAAVDYPALISAADQLQNTVKQLRQGAESLNTLAGQLYVNWDKLLLDLDQENGRKQHVRIVKTRYPDATLNNGQVSQEERWESAAASRDLERAVGMVIEHKPAGRYDSEAERTTQPPGYAYIAPPGQSNQYGSWSNGVWSWLPQYLILSQVLRGSSYPPIRMDDWYDYDRARRRGETWYGRDGRFNRTWGNYRDRGSSMRRALEGWTSKREDPRPDVSDSRPRETWKWGGSGSSYSGSRYQNRGTFGGSRYQSRPSGGNFGFRSYSRGSGGRSFGRGGRR